MQLFLQRNSVAFCHTFVLVIGISPHKSGSWCLMKLNNLLWSVSHSTPGTTSSFNYMNIGLPYPNLWVTKGEAGHILLWWNVPMLFPVLLKHWASLCSLSLSLSLSLSFLKFAKLGYEICIFRSSRFNFSTLCYCWTWSCKRHEREIQCENWTWGW